MKVVITGGGTGGHIYPALSIARELRKRSDDLLFVGSEHGPEGRLAEQEGLRFESVPSGPIGRMLSFRTMKSFARLGMGVVRAYSLLRSFRPDVLIGTGGYTSAGVALAEWLRGGKVIIHEQNSIPGRTNRLLGRLAKKICVTFDESVRHFPPGKTAVTGLPVRPEIVDGIDRQTAAKLMNLSPDKFTLLVFGGSQGARAINDAVLDAAPSIISAGLQVIHQSGKKNYEEVMARRPDSPAYRVLPYIEDMAAAYCASDLVVSRSGASSIAEITVRGLPAIFIPYPYAQADHQARNAEAVSRAGGALVVEERNLTGAVLAAMVLDLADDRDKLQAMAANSKKLGRPDAAEQIVRIIYEVAGNNKELEVESEH